MTKTILRTTIILATTVMIFAFATTQTLYAYGYSHPTETTQDIGADGTWRSELAPNEVEHWAFTLSEARDQQYVIINVLTPSEATVDVYVDGEKVATATEVPPNIVLSLTAGPHSISVENTGDEEVYYSMYLGHIDIDISCPILGIDVCAFLSVGLSDVSNFVIHAILGPVLSALTIHGTIQAGQVSQNNDLGVLRSNAAFIIDNLVDPSFGLEEIKNEIIDIEGNITSSQFGLEEIKNEIIDIETDLATQNTQHNSLLSHSDTERDNTTLKGNLKIASGDRIVLVDNAGIGGTSDVEVTWKFSDSDCKVVTFGGAIGAGGAGGGAAALGGTLLTDDAAYAGNPPHADVVGTNAILVSAETGVCKLVANNGDFVTVSTVGSDA